MKYTAIKWERQGNLKRGDERRNERQKNERHLETSNSQQYLICFASSLRRARSRKSFPCHGRQTHGKHNDEYEGLVISISVGIGRCVMVAAAVIERSKDFA